MTTTIRIEAFSLATIRFAAKSKNTLFPATGFLLRCQNDYYLITALHVLTGRDWETKTILSKTGFVPEEFALKIPFYKMIKPGQHQLMWLDHTLVLDGPDPEVAPWFVHPARQDDVDVGIMPLKNLPDLVHQKAVAAGMANADTKIFAVDWDPQVKLKTYVGDDVFVVGFPENIKVAGEFPIWKRGSVASEPDIPTKDLPFLLVDTGTRGGMSGAPVFRRQPVGIAPTMIKGQFGAFEEPYIELFGIYTGRFGADDLTSQLGIVWKRTVVADMLAAPKLGKPGSASWLW